MKLSNNFWDGPFVAMVADFMLSIPALQSKTNITEITYLEKFSPQDYLPEIKRKKHHECNHYISQISLMKGSVLHLSIIREMYLNHSTVDF